MQQQSLLTTEQAAAYLGVKRTFLERDRWAGSKVPFVRVGTRTIRYRKSDLDEFVSSRLCSSTSAYQVPVLATG
ncbi:MAG: helix-turn-helix domain-containing protein [Pseudomonadota bacterium]